MADRSSWLEQEETLFLGLLTFSCYSVSKLKNYKLHSQTDDEGYPQLEWHILVIALCTNWLTRILKKEQNMLHWNVNRWKYHHRYWHSKELITCIWTAMAVIDTKSSRGRKQLCPSSNKSFFIINVENRWRGWAYT